MARVTFVKKRTVGKRGEYAMTCRTCGQPIEYGEPYKWFALKIGRSSQRNNYHPSCVIAPSHQTTSKMGVIYDAQAEFEDGDTVDDIQSNLASFAETVREVAAEYRESQQNIEDGFGHSTYQSDELGEKADALDDWADDLESVDLEDEPEREDDATDEEHEEALETWRDENRTLARDAVDNCPV